MKAHTKLFCNLMLVFAISMALFFYFGYILGNSNKEEYATHRFVELIITAANEGIVTMNFDNIDYIINESKTNSLNSSVDLHERDHQ